MPHERIVEETEAVGTGPRHKIQAESRTAARRALSVLVTGGFVLSVACEQPVEVHRGRIAELSNDRGTLQRLYRETNGTQWHRSEGWMSEASIGTWHGVGLLGRGGYPQVQSLYLHNNNLAGRFPASALQLRKLEQLFLEGNSLTGRLPTLGWERLTRLKDLNIYSNQLTGPIPTGLGKLANLESFWAFDNGFSGPIPPELGNLTKLRTLLLLSSGVSGPIPPELGNLTGLRWLRLDDNHLSGSIPPELGRLKNLTILALYVNSLSGSIPPELGNLTSLEALLVQGNDLSGSVPPEIGQLSKLTDLSIGWNPGLTGPLPMELTNLRLKMFYWVNTGLCAPSDSAFQAWLATIEDHRGGPICA